MVSKSGAMARHNDFKPKLVRKKKKKKKKRKSKKSPT